MNKNTYVYIGRFQIPHFGHEETIRYAFEKSEHLIIAVGSSDVARDPKNPFTFEERKLVLDEMCHRLASECWKVGREVKYDIVPVHDYVYNNNKWLMEVQAQVLKCTKANNITLTGYQKDESSFYLKHFPLWKEDFIQEVKSNNITINSTEFRKKYFSGVIPTDLPNETVEFLKMFKHCNNEVYTNLCNEHEFIINYRKTMHDSLPYTNIAFYTGDSIVVSAGHILLVKRKSMPGKGLYALPGGFFDGFKDQDGVEAALRELKEETKIDVPEKVLKGNIRRTEVFGDKERSLRWRIITTCIYIQLEDQTLPKVKGSDDAECAMWVPLGDLEKNRHMMFEDHYSIISCMLGI